MWLIGTTYGTYDLTNKEIIYLTIAGYGFFFWALTGPYPMGAFRSNKLFGY